MATALANPGGVLVCVLLPQATTLLLKSLACAVAAKTKQETILMVHVGFGVMSFARGQNYTLKTRTTQALQNLHFAAERARVSAMEGEAKHRSCYLCGSTENLTRDHVPPKNLFRKPLPGNLITVDACASCNNSYSLDEEYFRAAMASQGSWNDTGKWIWKNKVVASTFARSPKLRQKFADSILPVEVKTRAGLYLGKIDRLTWDAKRINRVVLKILRGLFWHHYPQTPLGIEAKLTVDMINPTGNQREVFQSLFREQIGGDTFAYWRGNVEDDCQESLWIFAFYGQTFFSAQTARGSSGESNSFQLLSPPA